MLNNSFSSPDVLSSKFTRKKGFVNIHGSLSLSRKKAIQILNSFTPQGASPEESFRIGTYDDYLGIGYYAMEDEASADLRTILFSFEDKKYQKFSPNFLFQPEKMSNNDIILFEDVKKENFLNFAEIFGNEGFSIILYSYLTGDNIILVDQSHEVRKKFIATLLDLTPAILLKYNRITTECFELDGNENIIGVCELPTKFRSHTKLYLPLDSIFVDIENGKIEGNGIKNSTLTKEIVDNYGNDRNQIFNKLCIFIRQAIENPKEFDFDESIKFLADRINKKLGNKIIAEENWLADF